jgi:hypothetical protein
MRSIMEERLERTVFFGENSLRHAIREYLSHYHGERNHQGLANRILVPGEEVGRPAGEIPSQGHSSAQKSILGLARSYAWLPLWWRTDWPPASTCPTMLLHCGSQNSFLAPLTTPKPEVPIYYY